MSSSARESSLNNSASTKKISNAMLSRDNKDIGMRHEAEVASGTTLKGGTRAASNINGTSSEDPAVSNNERSKSDENTDVNDGEGGDDNNNSAQRATVICRQIDTNRLKNSGLHLQIAQALLKKAMQKQQIGKQNSITQTEQKEKSITIQLDTIATPTTKISSFGGVSVSAKKPPTLISLPSSGSAVLSVPKITITSPPCDTKPETLRDSKINRLEDVKRILNRQILMRKLSSTEGNAMSIPLNSLNEQTIVEKTTLQLPPQTIIKSIKKIETSTTDISNTSEDAKFQSCVPSAITVRKIQVTTSPHAIKPPLSSKTSPQKTKLVMNLAPIEDSTSTVRVLTKQGLQAISITPTSPSLHSNNLTVQLPSSTILSTKAVTPTEEASSSKSTTTPFSQVVTVPSIRSISTEKDTNSLQPQTQTAPPTGDLVSHTHITTANSHSRLKVLHTISTSKPKIFEIQCPKRPKENEKEKTKQNDEQISKRLCLSGGNTTVKVSNTTLKSPKVFKVSDSIIQSPKSLLIATEGERAEVPKYPDSESLPKTKNVPIVLENKLLQPDEQIDLKGLCLNRANLSEGHTHTEAIEDIAQRQQQTLLNAKVKEISPSQKLDPKQNVQQIRKMHVIISNEKLKSPKLDMAALAKQVLQRATKNVSDGDSDTQQQNTSETPKRKLKISKASINLMKTQSTTPVHSPQRAILRKKILDLCRIKDDAHISPAREYPETVEIMEESDSSDYDEEGPTAVDFIASLAMSDFEREPSKTTSAAAAGLDGASRSGVAKQPNIEINLSETSEEGGHEKKSLEEGAVKESTTPIEGSSSNKETAAQNNDKVKTIDEHNKDEDERKVQMTSEETKNLTTELTSVADYVSYCSLQPQSAIKANVMEISEKCELKEKFLEGVVKGEICTIGKSLSNERKVKMTKEVPEIVSPNKPIRKAQDDAECSEESLKLCRSNESTLENEQKTNSVDKTNSNEVETSLIIDEKGEKSAFQDTLESMTKAQTKNEIESRISLDQKTTPKEINASLLEKNELENRKVVNIGENLALQKKDESETNKKSEVPGENATTTTKARKRIGLRNAPINLIARKKSAQKKPIISPKKHTAQSTTTPEISESLIDAEGGKSANLGVFGDDKLQNSEMKAEECATSSETQQEEICKPLDTLTDVKSNDADNKEPKNIIDSDSFASCAADKTMQSERCTKIRADYDVIENESNSTAVLMSSTDSLNTPTSSALSEEFQNKCHQVSLQQSSTSKDERYSAPEEGRKETCKSLESKNKDKDKDSCNNIDETSLEMHGIKVLATVPIADSLQSNTERSSSQSGLPEVGTIIDMKAFGIDQVLRKQIRTIVSESVDSQALSTACDNIPSDSKSRFLDDNDRDNNSDNDQIGLKTGQKSLHRTKRIARILSSSDSEPETNEPMESCSSKSSNLTRLALDDSVSSTSNGSDLFGFAQEKIEFEEQEGKGEGEGEEGGRKNFEDDCANTMESISSTTSEVVSKLSVDKTHPSVTSTGSRGNNVPLKKRWEVSSNKRRTHADEIDISHGDASTADGDDNDTMGCAEFASNFITYDDKDQVEDLEANRSSRLESTESISRETVPAVKFTEEVKNELKDLDNTSKSTPVVIAFNLSPIKDEEISVNVSVHSKKANEKASRKRGRIRNDKSILSDTEEQIELKVQTAAKNAVPLDSTPHPKRKGRPPKKVKILDPQACDSLEIKSKNDSISGTDAPDSALKRKCGRKTTLESSLKVLEVPECSILSEGGNLNDSLELQTPSSRRKSGRKKKQTTGQCSIEEERQTKDDERPKREESVGAIDETRIKKKRGRKPQQKTSTPMQIVSCTAEEKMELDHSFNDSEDNVPLTAMKKCKRTPLEGEESLCSDFQQSINEDIVVVSSTPVAPKKRGRKPRVLTPAGSGEVQEGTTEEMNPNQTNEAPKKKRQTNVGDFNPRFLLIRKRDQLDTEEILTVAENERGDGPLQCGVCLARTTQSNWYKHLREHYGVGWIMDKEPAIDITTRSTILSRMFAYFKRLGKATTLSCRLCARFYKSPLGLLLHLESCGDTIRIECPFCGQKYTKLSYTVHQRTCQKPKKDTTADADDEEKVNDVNESILSNTGRFKRAAQIRAETKLKNLTTELSNDLKFEPRDFIKHTENQAEGAQFQCVECIDSFRTEADAINHVLEHHKPNDKSIKAFEADGSDYEGNIEVNYEDRESTSESEISSVESDSDDLASPNKRVKDRKGKYETKRPGSLPMVYPWRVRDVPKLVLKKWKQFIGSNYTTDTLYPNAMPIYNDEDHSRAKELISAEFESMNFAFSDNRTHFKALSCSKTDQEWKKLRRFESMDQNSADKLICLGKPIKTIAWVPLNDNISEQYLVVSCRKSLSSFTRHSKPKCEAALLFVYKIEAIEKEETQAKNKGFHAKIHYVLHLSKGPVHTMAFLPSGGYSATQNRLGLLAIGTTKSDIEVFALPIEPEQFQEMKIEAIDEAVRVLSLMATFKLVLDASDTEAPIGGHPLSMTQCSHICWSEFSSHQHVIASYVHGYIAIWDIEEPVDSFYNLNCHTQSGRRLFTPLHYFYFGEKIINPFAVHYDTNGVRWLAVMGSARKHIVYDIRNLTNPIALKEEFLRNVPRDVDWSPIWEPYAAAFCDSIPNHGHCVLAISPVSIVYTHSRMEYMLCGVSTVHYNPWQSICCVGTDNGDILYVNTREMHHDLQVLIRSNSNVMAVSELDIKRLDGEEIVRLNPNSNQQNWQMYEKDYKGKYGLVFTNITKFKSSDRKAYLSEQRTPPRNVERYMRISTLRWNLNALGKRYVAIGYENGFLRVMRFKRETFFE